MSWKQGKPKGMFVWSVPPASSLALSSFWPINHLKDASWGRMKLHFCLLNSRSSLRWLSDVFFKDPCQCEGHGMPLSSNQPLRFRVSGGWTFCGDPMVFAVIYLGRRGGGAFLSSDSHGLPFDLEVTDRDEHFVLKECRTHHHILSPARKQNTPYSRGRKARR